MRVLECLRRGEFDPLEILDYLVEKGSPPSRPQGEGPDALSPTMFSIFLKDAVDTMLKWDLNKVHCYEFVWGGGLKKINERIHDPEEWKLILAEVTRREEERERIRKERIERKKNKK